MINPWTTSLVGAEQVAEYSYDGANHAIRTNVLNGVAPANWDYLALVQASNTDTWTYKQGGSGGTTLRTVTITYTDSTKATISNVALV